MEIDYEKEYTEALERAKRLRDSKYQTMNAKRVAEEIFPVLAESEDERMRKAALEGIEYLERDCGWDVIGDIDILDVKEYLEKQKESLHIQESCKENANFFTDACKDVIVAIEKYLDWLTGYPDYAPKGKYSLRDMLYCLSVLEKQKEQIPYTDFVIKPHKGDDTNPYDMSASEAQEYTIKRGFGIPLIDSEVYVDERHIIQTIGNILRWADEHPKKQKPIMESKRLANEVIKYLTKCGYSPVLKDDSKKEHFHIDIPRHKDDFWQSEEYKHCHSVLGEYYMEGDYGGDTYTLYIWREKKEQKPAWSEEDESFLDSIEDAISSYYDLNHAPQYHYWLEEKLKSLRSQSKVEWSEVDEAMLDSIISVVEDWENEQSEKEKEYYGATSKSDWLKSLHPPLKDREMKLKILKYLSTRCSSLEFEEVEDYLNNLRPSWKPSGEQMEYLSTTEALLRECGYNTMANRIALLCEELNKLI